MSTTYAMEHPEKGHIEYTDKKRYLWMSSLAMPAFPMLGIVLYFLFDSQWMLALPLVFSYLVIPFLDYAIGSDENNPPEEIVPQLEQDRYYRLLTWFTVPMHFIVLIAMAALGVVVMLAGFVAPRPGLPAPGVIWRIGATAAILCALANPSIVIEDRTPLSDIGLVVVDRETEREGVSQGQNADLSTALWLEVRGAEAHRVGRETRCPHVGRENDAQLHVVSKEAVVDALGGGGQNKFRTERLHHPKAEL